MKFPFMLELVEKPDSSDSQHYPAVVGESYKILDTSGCCFYVEFHDGSTGFMNKSRFARS